MLHTEKCLESCLTALCVFVWNTRSYLIWIQAIIDVNKKQQFSRMQNSSAIDGVFKFNTDKNARKLPAAAAHF